MKLHFRLTLAQLLGLTTVTLALALGVTFWVVLDSSRRSILRRSDELRDAAALRIRARVSAELEIASAALDEFAAAVRFGALSADDPRAAENRLFSEMLAHPTLSDMTLTHASLLGRTPTGEAEWAPQDRWQITVYRASADPGSELITRRISMDQNRFVADVRRRAPQSGLLSAPFLRESAAVDPTSHPTFQTPVSERLYGRAIWSDLSFSELDATRPQAARRVVVTVQEAVDDESGRFAGVVRVGLLTETIDELPRLDTTDSQRVFLCDRQGRLVARVDPADTLEVVGDDLRVTPHHLAPEITAALESLRRHGLSDRSPQRSLALSVGGTSYLATVRDLDNSQDWLVGVVVPEDYYTRDLRALRDRFTIAMLVVGAIVLACSGGLIQSVRKALERVVAAMARMRDFDFSPSTVDAPVREMVDVMEGIERAKTSMRGLSKYVPVDLVRELYESNREPELGGELCEISLMFSDIEGFTGLSERLTPDALARTLGRYLEAMTAGVRSTQGTIDKFIGDSVMAFWNAPTRRPDHARRACEAVLACLRNTSELFASASWQGMPPLFTRFGLHRARVMVGHFGAPDRLSYTALGDGVNLASRLEGLCKHYGVAVLASEAIVAEVGDSFAFRLVDRVAVKGKHEAVRVYELLGAGVPGAAPSQTTLAYERALEAYFSRDFRTAMRLLAGRGHDPPSRVLSLRCAEMLERPPPEDWNGVYVASDK